MLPNRIPCSDAECLAHRCLDLHADSANRDYITGDAGYQTLFGMLNLEDRVWNCPAHPDPVAIARHFLGPNGRVVEACSKPTWPGAPAQSLHADSTGEFRRGSDVAWMINTIWRLSDFTEANGSTDVASMSHRSWQRPSADVAKD